MEVEEPDGFEVVGHVPIAKLPYNNPGTAYTIVKLGSPDTGEWAGQLEGGSSGVPSCRLHTYIRTSILPYVVASFVFSYGIFIYIHTYTYVIILNCLCLYFVHMYCTCQSSLLVE